MTERGRLKLTLIIALMAVSAFGYWAFQNQRASKQLAEQSRADAETRRLAEQQAEREALESWLAGMTEEDFRVAGRKCVDAVTSELEDRDSFGWDFIDWDPYEFSSIKTSVYMGLNLTAFGSETSGLALIEDQVPVLIRNRQSGGTSFAFRFIVSERRESYSGLKQVLSHYVCRISSPENILVYQSDQIVL
ncbi:hypothetical protein [Ruegeria arenilitoris]|uniref:hypothetical protein n=1 Tax=Ruegeria arenilitoris TaxID=1173585 RepID=UPI00147EF9A7|nr:hypothetical protein [Ruegeria arenilitoris]